MSVAVAAACPLCAEPVDAADVFCQACGAQLKTGAEAKSASAPVPGGSQPGPAVAAEQADAEGGAVGAAGGQGVVGPAGVATGPRPEPGDEIGGVDSVSVAFDAAAAGPPRRPGVVVRDADLDVVPLSCGVCSGRIAEDGYCEQCGAPAKRLRDHWAEQPAPWVSMVCDRGLRHAINQDAVAVGAAPEPGSFAVIVICDGVSSAARSEVASLAAARAARDVLVAPRADSPTATPPAPVEPAVSVEPAAPVEEPVEEPVEKPAVDPEAEVPISSTSSRSKASVLAGTMRAAGAAAQAQALAAASDPPEANPPACTFVAAVIENRLLVTGCIGDSRAYWLPDAAPAVQVSTDDSWAAEAMALGMPREDAERAPLAHSITRWLGSDAPDPVPRTAARHLDEPGWVLLCSDGLWNYCSEAAGVHDLVLATASRVGQDGAAIAEALVAWANEQGGHDNISVALARID